ncbi:hypothetical protein GCM10010286_30920 [Streptomyces toxytricini]|nr:hypothetical protein GCM10010286_30920 [Streptomyces toxytricini]
MPEPPTADRRPPTAVRALPWKRAPPLRPEPTRRDSAVPLDVSRTGPHRGRLSAQDARRRLEHARSSRAAQLQALLGGGQSPDGHLMSAQAEANRRVLKEIEEAFARLDDGSYGTCLSCSAAVPAERLEILPYTRYCVACQNRLTT